MTVTVTLRDGTSEIYMRFGDAYVKHGDGTLDIIRGGVKGSFSYAPGEWTDVQGDQKTMEESPFLGLRQTGRFSCAPPSWSESNSGLSWNRGRLRQEQYPDCWRRRRAADRACAWLRL